MVNTNTRTYGIFDLTIDIFEEDVNGNKVGSAILNAELFLREVTVEERFTLDRRGVPGETSKRIYSEPDGGSISFTNSFYSWATQVETTPALSDPTKVFQFEITGTKIERGITKTTFERLKGCKVETISTAGAEDEPAMTVPVTFQFGEKVNL